VMDGYAMIKVLAGRYRRRELLLLVNQTDPDHPDQVGTAVAHNLQNVASRFLPVDGVESLRLELAASVPLDEAITQAVSRQQLLLTVNPNAPAAKSIQHLAQYLMRRPAAF
jgi:MinD-like ATPase involved in chromosome partitioning or flagellar assembly